MMKRDFLKTIFGRGAAAMAASLILLTSCIEKLPKPPVFEFDGRVLVINEGNFSDHSATISLYSEELGEIKNGVFKEANDIYIGTTITSGSSTLTGEALLVCNNPDKIEIVDSKSGKIVESEVSDGLENPRTAVAIGEKIYVTNWGYEFEVDETGWRRHYHKSFLAVYDRGSKTQIDKIEVGTGAEGLLVVADRIFIATEEGVRVFTNYNDQIELLATISPDGDSDGAKHMVMDNNFNVWASFPSTGLVKIDPTLLKVDKVIDLPLDDMDAYIAKDLYGEYIYSYYTEFDENYQPVEATIYKIATGSGVVTPIYTGTYFYGIGVSPSTGDIFTAETSFTANSTMKVISPEGELKNSVVAGIAAKRFLFY